MKCAEHYISPIDATKWHFSSHQFISVTFHTLLYDIGLDCYVNFASGSR